jgi:26S proteasome regulatory subunit N4
LRNDYKALMNRIEAAVHAQFAALSSGEAVAAPAPSASLPSRPAPSAQQAPAYAENATPFAVVDQVFPDSPAATAGLQRGDKVVEFGEASWLNQDAMRKVAEVVSRHEGVGFHAASPPTPADRTQRPLQVRVLRGTESVQLQLTPRRDWGGRGTLGCHIVPI